MKPPICSVCKFPFERKYTSLQKTCGIKCSIIDATEKRELKEHREQEKRIKSDRRNLRQRKEEIRPKIWYVKKAQAAFNAFVRERDRGDVCISCQKPPKKVQAGHYKTTAARPDIRFHPFNNNLQCFHCNVHKSGAIDLYRPNLIKKIGLSNVEWLESEQPLQNHTVDDLIEIKIYYREQLKLLGEGK